MWRLCRSSMIYVSLIAVALIFPLLLFPNSMIYFFDSSFYDLFKEIFGTFNYWIWLYIIALTVHLVFCGILVAARDLKFQLYSYFMFLATDFVPVYLIIHLGKRPADNLWLIIAIGCIFFAALFFFRFLQRKWEEKVSITRNTPI